MSITRNNPNTIFLGGAGDIIEVGDIAVSATTTPGMLVELFNNGGIIRYRPATSNGLAGPAAVALDQPELNKGVDDTYAANDLARVAILKPGQQAWMLLASGQVIAAGDLLGDNGSSVVGTLKGSPTVARFIALENKPAPQSTATIRIRVQAL